MDASAIVAVVAQERTSEAVDLIVQPGGQPVLASDFALAESSAALAKRGRTERRRADEIEGLFVELDGWTSMFAERIQITSGDIDQADALVRDLALGLRAPDAIHLAATRRLGVTLVTLDKTLARAAAALSVPCINPAEASAT